MASPGSVAHEVAALALECDLLAVRALLARLRVQLRSAGVATRRVGEDLVDTWQRADAGRTTQHPQRAQDRSGPRGPRTAAGHSMRPV